MFPVLRSYPHSMVSLLPSPNLSKVPTVTRMGPLEVAILVTVVVFDASKLQSL